MVDVLSRSLTSFVDHTLIVATPKLIVKNVKSVVPIPVANIAWKVIPYYSRKNYFSLE